MRMRASLRHHLGGALRRGRLAALALGGLRAAAARLDLPLPGPLGGPLLATFALTYRCPLRCAMCDLPLRARGELDDAAVLRFVEAIADLRPLGLGFTGGEPLLRPVLFPALERAARRGIVAHLNTSGVGLDEAAAERIVAAGTASVNVSIDHDAAEEHDRLRGRRQALRHALAALERLAAARTRAGASLRLQAVMAVSIGNLSRVSAVTRLAREHGADATSLLPVHDLAPRRGDGRDETAPASAAAELLALPLENSPAYLRGIVPFLAGGATPGPCSAARTALFLDPTGRAFACTPGATQGAQGIPATPETLGRIVRSGSLAATVPPGRCDRCWWNCHRELDIALGASGAVAP